MTSRRPRVLDLFCGAGGCSVGYHRAGYDVVGVDIQAHPDYPFPIVVTDAVAVARIPELLDGFDLVHASPPCPRYSHSTNAAAREKHPDLVPPVRDALKAWGGTWVIENVPGAPMTNAVILCGSMFGLGVRRHRLFDTNAPVMALHCDHKVQGPTIGVYGNPDTLGAPRMRPDGSGSRGQKAGSVAEAQLLLGIDWMTDWDDLTDSIPPAYTEYIGRQILEM